MGRSPARLDFAKIENLNGHYIRHTDDAALTAQLKTALPHLPGGPALLESMAGTGLATLQEAMPGLKERAKTLVELTDNAQFLFAKRPLAMDAKAAALLTDEAKSHLKALAIRFESLEPWDAPSTEAVVRSYAEKTSAKLGAVAQPLRAALTGRATSPGIFDVLAVLGRAEAIGRLRDQSK